VGVGAELSALSLALALSVHVIGGAPSDDAVVVCLSADTLPICSGVVIGKRTVLTAGHCINTVGPGVTYWVNFGADCRAPSSRVKVKSQRAHPQYTAEGAPFDLGLLELVSDVAVTPVALGTLAVDASLVGQPIRHVGYGASSESPLAGWGTQRTVTHPLTRLDDDFLYSGDARFNTCTGDSGGPLFLGEALLAVVSDGPDCHSEGHDQRIDRGREWIDASMVEFEPAPPVMNVPKQGCSVGFALWTVLAALLLLRRRR